MARLCGTTRDGCFVWISQRSDKLTNELLTPALIVVGIVLHSEVSTGTRLAGSYPTYRFRIADYRSQGKISLAVCLLRFGEVR
jgi:hypothetical protein